MDKQSDKNQSDYLKNKNIVFVLAGALISAITLLTLVYIYREIRFMVNQPINSSYITVTGSGEVFAPPNIAEITFTVRETNLKTSEAQKILKDKTSQVGSALKELKVEDKDVITENYNSYPKYEYNPQNGKQTFSGFEVSQTVRIKVRDLNNLSQVLDRLGTLNVSEIQGPNFTQDDIEKIKSEARGKAIEDAEQKIEALSKQLGLRVVRVSEFSEGSDTFQPQPIMFKTVNQEFSEIGGSAQKSVNDGIFVGEQKTTAKVSITYELK